MCGNPSIVKAILSFDLKKTIFENFNGIVYIFIMFLIEIYFMRSKDNIALTIAGLPHTQGIQGNSGDSKKVIKYISIKNIINM